jgi:hypothetical protein
MSSLTLLNRKLDTTALQFSRPVHSRAVGGSANDVSERGIFPARIGFNLGRAGSLGEPQRIAVQRRVTVLDRSSWCRLSVQRLLLMGMVESVSCSRTYPWGFLKLG